MSDLHLPAAVTVIYALAPIPIVASAALVFVYRNRLPYPRMWSGVLAWIAIEMVRVFCSVFCLMFGQPAWAYGAAIFSCIAPAVMFFVGCGLVRRSVEQKEHVEDLESKVRDALKKIEEATRDAG